MRKFLSLSLLIIISSAVSVRAQSEQLTPEEQKAVQTIRDRFNERIDKEGWIEPLISEMFVTDLGTRYAKEKKADLAAGPTIPLTPGIDVKREVLDAGTEEEWRHALTATFNFMHVISLPMLNSSVRAATSGKPFDPDVEGDLNKILSKPVLDIFAKDPVLKNYFEKQGTGTPIATVEDLRRVADILDKARAMVSANLPPADRKLSPEATEAMKGMINDKDFGPWVTVAGRESYGFPKGTRFITFFANPMEALMITKVGGEYKIVSAQISSPD